MAENVSGGIKKEQTMGNIISERVETLRRMMREEHLSAVIIPSTDPHNGEYVPIHWEARKWISGFDGSAGTAVVTQKSAALWTDSRYFLAAEEQLRGTEYVLMRERMADTPTISQWLGHELRDEDSPEVAIDGMCCTASEAESLIKELRAEGGITLRTNLDAVERIWKDRPAIPENPVFIHPMDYAGETTGSKLTRIRAALRAVHADGMLVSALDDIAWTLNLRGADVHCNPVFVSYLIISSNSATLYINKVKLDDEVRGYLSAHGVDVADYEDVRKGLRDYFEYNILVDPDETSYTLMKAIRRNIILHSSPIPMLKAVKNEAEIEGFRRAMLRDGVAMVKFLSRLHDAVGQGRMTEMSADTMLTAFRAEQPHFRGLSFDTIVGYQEHAAIVHYEATPATDVPLRPEGLVLIDSGAHYSDGTTDITRTIALGPLSEEQRRVYTLVLKGHIQLQMLKFPEGASGTQLDAIARKDLWTAGLNFMHGTGHGVGSFLSVHEGPHQIRMEYRPAPLRAGMTVTDEPGIYLAGRFGVRIENTLLIVPWLSTECGSFLGFETLTICPIDTAPVIVPMLTPDEREWLNGYHRTVWEKLSPWLDDAEKAWLRKATMPID